GAAVPLVAAPFLSYDTGRYPHAVAIGDLNGDGKPDLVTAGLNAVSVLLAHGGASFGVKSDYYTGSGSCSVAIGDLNGDGQPDLAVANAGSYPDFVGSVSVLLGNGDGSFGGKTSFGTGSSARSVGVGELKGDGQAR